IVSFDLFGLDKDRARDRLLEQVGILRAGRAKPSVPPGFPAQDATSAGHRQPAGRPARLLRRASFSVPGLTALAFSPDSQLLATAASGFAAWWRIGGPVPASPTRWAVVTAENAVGALTFSADGRLLACAGDKTALWDITDPSMPTQLAGFAHGYRKRDEK